jgi:hypothetical protein
MRIIALLVLLSLFIGTNAQNLPLGYIPHFESDFSDKVLPKNLLFSPSANHSLKNGVLLLQNNPDSVVMFKPSAAMLIDNNIFGDFITEITLINNTTGSDSTSGVFFIFGLRNRDNYYWVKLNNKGAEFSKMYKGKTDIISSDSGFVIPNNKSVKLRIERNILERSIVIKYQQAQVKFSDPNLVMGYFGMGTNSSKIGIDKITVWAPTSLAEPLTIFNK